MTDKTTGLDPNVIDPRTRTIEALSLELDRVNAENENLRKTIEWYADLKWVRTIKDFKYVEIPHDFENKARKALEGAKK